MIINYLLKYPIHYYTSANSKTYSKYVDLQHLLIYIHLSIHPSTHQLITRSGIFISPVAIVRQCQSVGLSLTVWLAGGILMLGLILSYVELAMMFPRAGGDYAYLLEINGPVVAFLRFEFMKVSIWIPEITRSLKNCSWYHY